MIVTNEYTVACCGETVANCKCGGQQAPVINSERPAGGALGIPSWYGRSTVAETPVLNADLSGQPYLGAGAGQFDPPRQVANSDDNKPAGGSLGIPVWKF